MTRASSKDPNATFVDARKIDNVLDAHRPRVIVTTDGEADDRCSMVRFLLSSNEFQVEGIVNSSSQFHWEGGSGWNALHPVSWVRDYIGLYAQVYENLLQHDPSYPAPEYLLSRWKVGNVNAVGEVDLRTEGAELIAEVLLDASDPLMEPGVNAGWKLQRLAGEECSAG